MGSLGSWQGRARGSPSLTGNEDDRFSLLDTADTAGCRRRAENRVEACRARSGLGLKGDEEGEEPWLAPLGTRVFLAWSADCLVEWLGFVVP